MKACQICKCEHESDVKLEECRQREFIDKYNERRFQFYSFSPGNYYGAAYDYELEGAID